MATSTRPPVITIMGHVDHGKTTLLDHLRQSRVTAGEAGGITQHIGAYQIEHDGQKMTFIDTPGHAAFNKMRERGAEITDIVILVVAADDGVQPQTKESIDYIKQSGATPIVAINKIDLDTARPEVAKSELAEAEFLIQEYGGEIESVEISAETGENVEQLLETISVMAELLELEADVDAPLEAVVIESTKDQFRGPIATVIVQQGSLEVRQNLYTTETNGRVKSLTDDHGEQMKTAGPGDPVEIMGLNEVPPVGSVIRDADAKYETELTTEEEVETNDDPFADLDIAAAFGEKEILPIMLRADVKGTLEALQENLEHENVEIVDAAVGAVSDRDLEVAETTGAVIIAFHTDVPNRVKRNAKQQGIIIREYDVIYELIEELEEDVEKMIDPTYGQEVVGVAEILEIFDLSGTLVAGSRVKTGEISKTDKINLRRDGEIIATPRLSSLQRGQEKVDRVTAKSEFGATFRGRVDFQVGDVIEAYTE